MMHSTHLDTVIWKEGRKEVFYLMMHSTHLDTVTWKEGSVLFNDALNTFRYGYM